MKNEDLSTKVSQDVFDLYDDYAHNRMLQKQFMDRLSKYVVTGFTLPTLLSFIMPN